MELMALHAFLSFLGSFAAILNQMPCMLCSCICTTGEEHVKGAAGVRAKQQGRTKCSPSTRRSVPYSAAAQCSGTWGPERPAVCVCMCVCVRVCTCVCVYVYACTQVQSLHLHTHVQCMSTCPFILKVYAGAYSCDYKLYKFTCVSA